MHIEIWILSNHILKLLFVKEKVPCSAKTPSQLISLDFQVSGLHAFDMKILTYGGGRTVSQSARLHVVQPGGMDSDSRAQTAAQRVQAEVEEASAEEQRPPILVVALKDLGKLDI